MRQHDQHAGHDPEQFRRKLWLSLALTIPIVVTSDSVMDWFGYSIDFPGIKWVAPVLGSASTILVALNAQLLRRVRLTPERA